MRFFSKLSEMIDGILDSYILDTSTKIIGHITPVFTSMVIIWLAIWGYMVMFGKTNEPMTEGFFRILRVSFIITLALTVGTYNHVVVDFLQKTPQEIASVISGGDGEDIEAIIDDLLTNIFNTAKKSWDQCGLGSISNCIISVIVLLFGGAMLFTTAFLFTLSKIYTAILLAVGPIFIVMLLFNTTHRYFESWLGYLMNYGFILILAVATTQLTIDLTEAFMNNAKGDFNDLAGAFILALLFSFNIAILKQIPTIASALGGGFAMATNTGIGEALHRLRPTSLRHSARRLRMDGIVAGRALASPVRGARALYGRYRNIGTKGMP
jgi:type IV secretion system protein VirB6